MVAGGGTSYGYGYVAVSEMPTMSSGQVNKVKCDITFIGRFISY